jgi:hypothetical protein
MTSLEERYTRLLAAAVDLRVAMEGLAAFPNAMAPAARHAADRFDAQLRPAPKPLRPPRGKPTLVVDNSVALLTE